MKLKKFSADVSEWRNLILKGTTHIRVDLWGVRKNKLSCLFFITTLNLVQPKIFSRNHVASLGGWFVLGSSPVAEYYNVTLDVNAVVELLQEKQFSMFVKVKQCTCSRDDALLTTFFKEPFEIDYVAFAVSERSPNNLCFGRPSLVRIAWSSDVSSNKPNFEKGPSN